MDPVLGVVRFGREGHGEFLRGHVPLLLLPVLLPFLEILLPVIAVGQSRARRRQDDGEKSATGSSDDSVHVHMTSPSLKRFANAYTGLRARVVYSRTFPDR